MKRYITLITAVTATLFNTYAQKDSLNAVVQVENEYAPVVIKAKKISSTPHIEMPDENNQLDIVFSQNGKPYGYFLSERDVKEVLPKQENVAPGYARFGYGIGNNVDAVLAYSLEPGKNDKLKLSATADGYKTDIDGIVSKWNSRLYNSRIAADYKYFFEKFTIGVDGEISNIVFNYQPGLTTTDINDKQHSNRYRIGASFESQNISALSYDAKIGYTANTRKYSAGKALRITENHITAKGNIAYELPYENFERIGARISVDGLIYNKALKPKGASQYTNYAMIGINPYTTLRFNGWTIRAGAHLDMLTANGSFLAVAPDCNIEGQLTDNISLNVSVTGGRSLNTFEAMEQKSPYWNYTPGDKQLTATYRIADFNTNLRLSYTPFTINIFAGYAYTKDDLLPYVTSDEQVYTMFTNSISRNAYAGAMAGYDYNGWFSFKGDIRYNNWSCTGDNYLIMFKPMLTANLKAQARLFDTLYTTLGYTFTKYTEGGGIDIDNMNSFNVKVDYRFHKEISAYLQGINLLDSNYPAYPGYYHQGIAIIAGVSVNF